MISERLSKPIFNYLESIFNRLADKADRSYWIKFLRKCLPLHPLSHALYHYRIGNMRRACKIIDNLTPKSATEKNLFARIKEISEIVNKGHQPAAPKPVTDVEWNERVLFTLHYSLPYDQIGYSIRSHSILTSLTQQGIHTLAVTRLAYPWDLPLLATEPFRADKTIDGVTYARLIDDRNWLRCPDSEYINAYAQKLAGKANEHAASIIHSASNYLNGLAAAKAAQQTGCRSIYEMRGLWHLTRAAKEPGFKETDHFRYDELMEINAAREVDSVVTISETLRAWLINKGISSEKITVVPNAVDTSLFSPIAPDLALKKRLGLEDKSIIGFIGSLLDYEGLDLLMTAVSTLIDQGANLALLLVGTGDAEDKLKKQARTLPNKDCIQFVGQVAFSDVKKYYSIIDIFPFPRQNFEVCRLVPPLKVLEVMAMAKPVIVPELPALLEMVKDGQTGIVFNPSNELSLRNALSGLLDHPDKCEFLGNAAKKWVKKNRAWETISRQYLTLYREVCEKNN